jgi:hypothetical protein
MSITFPLSLPSSDFLSAKIGASFNNTTSVSLSRKAQVVSRPGDLLTMSFNLPPLERAEAMAWVAFGMALRGRYGTFYGYDPVQKINGARGAYGGTPLVVGAGNAGYSIPIDGCSAGVTGWGKAGDWVQINGLYRMLTEDVSTNGSGQATLSISPGIGLGQAPADNAPVTTGATAKGVFRLTGDEIEWEVDAIQLYGLQFSAVEDLAS